MRKSIKIMFSVRSSHPTWTHWLPPCSQKVPKTRMIGDIAGGWQASVSLFPLKSHAHTSTVCAGQTWVWHHGAPGAKRQFTGPHLDGSWNAGKSRPPQGRKLRMKCMISLILSLTVTPLLDVQSSAWWGYCFEKIHRTPMDFCIHLWMLWLHLHSSHALLEELVQNFLLVSPWVQGSALVSIVVAM